MGLGNNMHNRRMWRSCEWEFGLVGCGGQAMGEAVVMADMDDNVTLVLNPQPIHGSDGEEEELEIGLLEIFGWTGPVCLLGVG
ncbi:Hypothetical predicted protein [Olea europaea subsp. europaea]|uniref:Uncharacterized protein n=1 Tax=Olea europaea subsp. europaea TaxID=158383 RepID=A0A8S0U5D9_OLEEU|nr:Hypothetical predicted protein [Olea europaea subsp. europaea]